MSVDKAVRRLNADLSHLRKSQKGQKTVAAKEKKAATREKSTRANIATQEQAIIDQFTTGAIPVDQQKAALDKLFGLGQKDQQAIDAYNKSVKSDKGALAKLKKAAKAEHKKALKDLKPAEYHLGLKATNKDRKALGLKALKKPLRQGSTKEPWKPGAGTLKGSDTSSWQSTANFEASIRGHQWAAVKATEGTHYVDPNFKARWNVLGKKIKQGSMKLRMAYCYLDAGNGVGQAKHFLNTLGIHGKLQPGTRLTLDWEGAALGSPSTLRDAANYIHEVTGTWPVVYCQGSEVGAARAAVPHAPLWEAEVADSAGDALPVSERNRNVPFFQYAWKPWDQDQFNGNLKALERFAGWS